MKYSISDIVFFMIATTVCYLAINGRITAEQFLGIAWIVFWSFYVHKAQNKWIWNKSTSDENTKI